MCLTSLQNQPLSCLSVMIHSGISVEMDSRTSPLKTKQNLPNPGTPMGWGWNPRLRGHAHVWLPLSPSDASGLESKPSSYRPRGSGGTFQFLASPPPSSSAFFLNQASMPFLRGQNEEQVAVD
ncbi:hypothetical protein HJG60_011925 [Phyllostomus discolor]|uniref:Uncharacterized protein n=1 Tax=Phyllostomus discolor TaxID=89673 RepID=A0A833ZIZ1_9CHIR|nr:hypothetical protein HJG60_011925 [Phyllostomus discolor]